jgi:hypothetical protein
MSNKIILGNTTLEVFVSECDSISIMDVEREVWVHFDECCAEKVCRMIMDTAKEIRGANKDAE